MRLADDKQPAPVHPEECSVLAKLINRISDSLLVSVENPLQLGFVYEVACNRFLRQCVYQLLDNVIIEYFVLLTGMSPLF